MDSSCIAVVKEDAVIAAILDWHWIEFSLCCYCVFMGSCVLPHDIHSFIGCIVRAEYGAVWN